MRRPPQIGRSSRRVRRDLPRRRHQRQEVQPQTVTTAEQCRWPTPSSWPKANCRTTPPNGRWWISLRRQSSVPSSWLARGVVLEVETCGRGRRKRAALRDKPLRIATESRCIRRGSRPRTRVECGAKPLASTPPSLLAPVAPSQRWREQRLRLHRRQQQGRRRRHRPGEARPQRRRVLSGRACTCTDPWGLARPCCLTSLAAPRGQRACAS